MTSWTALTMTALCTMKQDGPEKEVTDAGAAADSEA
jgi:hypothetical protein